MMASLDAMRLADLGDLVGYVAVDHHGPGGYPSWQTMLRDVADG